MNLLPQVVMPAKMMDPAVPPHSHVGRVKETVIMQTTVLVI